jgi:hypothetical protein
LWSPHTLAIADVPSAGAYQYTELTDESLVDVADGLAGICRSDSY